MVTHAGMTTAEFEQIVKDWITTAMSMKSDWRKIFLAESSKSQ